MVNGGELCAALLSIFYLTLDGITVITVFSCYNLLSVIQSNWVSTGVSFSSSGAIKTRSLNCGEQRTHSTVVFSHGKVKMVSLTFFVAERKLK